MAFPCCIGVEPGFFAETFKRRSPPEDGLVSDSVQNGGMGNRPRQARQKCRPKRDGQAATAAWLILRLMGRASSSNSGKSVPSAQPWLGCERSLRGRHVWTSSARISAMGDLSKELSPRRKRSMITSPVKASDHRRPKGLVSRKVSVASGRSFVSENGAPQEGQLIRQVFRQCFGIAPEAPSRACRSAHV